MIPPQPLLMNIRFTFTYTISAYHHWRYGIDFRSMWGILDTTLYGIKRFSVTCGRSIGTPPYSTNKSDRHNITELLFNVAFNLVLIVVLDILYTISLYSGFWLVATLFNNHFSSLSFRKLTLHDVILFFT